MTAKRTRSLLGTAIFLFVLLIGFDLILKSSVSAGSPVNLYSGHFQALLPSSPETCPVDTIAYWKLDEIGGTTFEDYFAANDGVCEEGKCPVPAAGFLNGAQYFLNDEVKIPSNPAFNWDANSSFSIELWVNPNIGLDAGLGIFISRHALIPAWWVGYEQLSGHASFAIRDSDEVGREIWGDIAINEGQWHHIVAVHDASMDEIQLYVDGELDIAAPVAFTGNWISQRYLGIGFHNDSYGDPQNHFTGRLDEIAIYGRALSPTEIQYQYKNGLPLQDYCEPVSLVVNTDGLGSVEEAPVGPLYPLGQEVTLTASPDPGYIFYDWSGDLTGYDNPATLTMDGDKVVTATFSDPIYYTLTLNTNGQGSVNVEPVEIEYLHGTKVTLSAVPASGWVFDGWSGDLAGFDNPATITMNEDKVITATFIEEAWYTVTVGIVGQGSVNVEPEQNEYLHGTQVTLTAVPKVDWQFKEWSGGMTGSDNPVHLRMISELHITATFSKISPVDEGDIKIYLPFNLKVNP